MMWAWFETHCARLFLVLAVLFAVCLDLVAVDAVVGLNLLPQDLEDIAAVVVLNLGIACGCMLLIAMLGASWRTAHALQDLAGRVPEHEDEDQLG